MEGARMNNKPNRPEMSDVPPTADMNKEARDVLANRMMYGVKRGISPNNVEALRTLRGMNRKQRRAAISQARVLGRKMSK
jgi:hypothetical protein